MRIGIYTDLHLCKTTSIMPLHCPGSTYSTRLQMCIDTAKWMYDAFEKEGVDIIVNGGDTLDGLNMSSEEVSALSEFYSYSKGTREIHITGNHEMYSLDSNFFTNKILSNLSFIEFYTTPTKIDDVISVIPYTNPENVTETLCKELANQVLISHIDINGTHLTESCMCDNGVDTDILSQNFGFVMNGHMHSREHIEKNIWNVGSVTPGSFSDNKDYIPSISIYDTETKEFKKINNPHSILFRKFTFKNLSQALKELNAIINGYRYCINVSCPYDIKEEVKDMICNKPDIIASRVTINEIKNNNTVKLEKLNETKETMGIEEQFLNYLRTMESLKFPMDNYKKIVEESTK